MTHLSDAELRAWADEGAGRDAVIGHLGVCDACSARYADMLRFQSPEEPSTVFSPAAFTAIGYDALRPRRTSFNAIAAALAVAAIVTLALVVDRSALRTTSAAPDPAARSTVRGVVETIAPRSSVEPPLVFRWTVPSGAAQFRLDLFDTASAPIFTTLTRTSPFDAPAELAGRLVAGHRYTWRVTALAADGEEIAASSPAGFELARRAQ